MLAPSGGKKIAFIEGLAVDLPAMAYVHWSVWSNFRRRQPVSENSVIDRGGYLTNDPQASMKMRQFYQKRGTFTFAVVLPLIPAMALSLRDPGIMIVGAFYITNAVWFLRASNKLEKRDWTIQTEPPQIRQTKKEKAALPAWAQPHHS